eukprot:8336059-Pyramimonas_sp.AAC.4
MTWGVLLQGLATGEGGEAALAGVSDAGRAAALVAVLRVARSIGLVNNLEERIVVRPSSPPCQYVTRKPNCNSLVLSP